MVVSPPSLPDLDSPVELEYSEFMRPVRVRPLVNSLARGVREVSEESYSWPKRLKSTKS